MPFRKRARSSSSSTGSEKGRFMIKPLRTILLLGAANTFFRIKVLKKVSKIKKKQEKEDRERISDNLKTAEDSDNLICLICWEGIPLESNSNCQQTTQSVIQEPSSPSTLAGTDTPLPPLSPMSERTVVMDEDELIDHLMISPTFRQTIWSKGVWEKVSVKGQNLLSLGRSKNKLLVEDEHVVQCTKGHRYHYTCLYKWILERQDKAPRSCEVCLTPYIGENGRSLISLAVQQTLRHHTVLPMAKCRTRAESVCSTALRMVLQFRKARQQFYDLKYLEERELGIHDVLKEFLEFYDLSSVIEDEEEEESKKVEGKGTTPPGLRDLFFAPFRKALEVLELYCEDC